MAYKVFTVPLPDSRGAEAELNAFLRGHRVLAVEKKFVELGANSFWTFCVDYLESRGDEPAGGERTAGGRNRIDYRDVLPPDQFAVFVKLRQWRQDVAAREAVPVYTVFTNEQLAKMVQNRVAARAGLEAIAGVGDARIEKYGTGVLDLLTQAWGGTSAPDGPPV